MSNAYCKVNQIISYFKKVYDHNSILSLNSLDETELHDVKKQLLKNLYVYNNNFILKNISKERKNVNLLCLILPLFQLFSQNTLSKPQKYVLSLI